MGIISLAKSHQTEVLMQAYFMQVFEWVTNPASYLGIGPMWLGIGILLLGFTILQLMPETWAGGKLFSRKMLFVTLFLDATWIYLVFVSPFVPVFVTIPLIVVAGLVILAILARNQWH
jgi:hypothetical protein